MGERHLQTTLASTQEAVAIALRKMLLISLDDLLAVVREFLNPNVSRSDLDQLPRRHGAGTLCALERAATGGGGAFDKPCTALRIKHCLPPPKSPRTNRMVERLNGRIEEVLQSHHFRSGEETETTLHGDVLLSNQ